MLFGLLLTLFVFVCMLLILVILIQQGKGGLGLGALGGSAQMLFGGSGGQDVFQKVTWVLGTIFMVGSFFLFILGSRRGTYSRYLKKGRPATPAQTTPVKGKSPIKLPAKKTVPVKPAAGAKKAVPVAKKETKKTAEKK